MPVTLVAGWPDVGPGRRVMSGDPDSGGLGAVAINRIFHDHECAYYDERFAIVYDDDSAAQARQEVERLLGEPLRAGSLVLDVGCGTGWLAAGLRRAAPGVRVVGADLSAGMLGRAAAAGATPLVQADVSRLPLRDGCVDVVVCRGVLHHLPEVTGALAEWRRLLRPGGAVVICSEPTPAVERDGEVLVRALLRLLPGGLSPEDDFWEVASMAANLHVFGLEGMSATARAAGYTGVDLRTADFVSTLVLTASYVMHGHRPGLARRLPWRRLDALGRWADRWLWDRVLPSGRRHTVEGALRP